MRSILFFLGLSTTFTACGQAKLPIVLGGSSDEPVDTATATDSGEPIGSDDSASVEDSGDGKVEIDTAKDSGNDDNLDSEDSAEPTDTGVEEPTDTGEVDEDTSDEADPFDNDGDGFAESDYYADCDDSRADVNPGEVEACDGVDNDCDGEIDEGTACEEDEEIDTGSEVVVDTGVIVADSGGDSDEAKDTAVEADTGDSGSEDTGGDTGFEDTAVVDTGSEVVDTGAIVDTGSASFPCTDCVEVVHTPSTAQSSVSSAFYGEGTSCKLMEKSYSVVTPMADGDSWIIDLPVTDDYLVRFSIDYGGSFYSCNGSALDGTLVAIYYMADGVTSCEVTVDELQKTSGGCEAQLVASCPDTPPTCPAF